MRTPAGMRWAAAMGNLCLMMLENPSSLGVWNALRFGILRFHALWRWTTQWEGCTNSWEITQEMLTGSHDARGW